MQKSRLEAFSDGVLAIIITIMVLELKAPHEGTLASLKPMVIPFCSYVLSFLYVGIYWNNHHHMLHTVSRVRGGVLWANLHLLFWLSLFPVVTHWLAESHLSAVSTCAYGVVLLMAATVYWLLQQTIIRHQGAQSILARAVGRDLKGKLSVLLYAIGVGVGFWSSWLALGIYLGVAIMWLVPDRRIEGVLSETAEHARP